MEISWYFFTKVFRKRENKIWISGLGVFVNRTIQESCCVIHSGLRERKKEKKKRAIEGPRKTRPRAVSEELWIYVYDTAYMSKFLLRLRLGIVSFYSLNSRTLTFFYAISFCTFSLAVLCRSPVFYTSLITRLYKRRREPSFLYKLQLIFSPFFLSFVFMCIIATESCCFTQ